MCLKEREMGFIGRLGMGMCTRRIRCWSTIETRLSEREFGNLQERPREINVAPQTSKESLTKL